MSRIRCISIHQPWVSLIAIGAKRIETRSWPTSYRGPLAIHAAKNTVSMHARHFEPFLSVFRKAGFQDERDFPLGGIVAVAHLEDCLPTESYRCLPGVFDEYPDLDTPQERAFGNYEPGRWGWVLSNVRRVDPAIPLVGHQGLFTIDASILPEGLFPSTAPNSIL